MTTKIVILNWNGAEVLPRFLPAVVANTPADAEIIVADNGSTDGSVELLRKDFPSVRVLLLDRNYGFAEGYNRALAMLDDETRTASASAPVPAPAPVPASVSAPAPVCHILLNSDVETPPGWCEPLVEMLREHPDVAAVAPKVLSFTEPAMFEYAGASGGFIDRLGYPFCRGRILGTIESDHGQYDDAREVFWATGACFACRADVFRDMGGFDGSFFAHQEELDLCWRMQLAGWRIMVEPRSKVWHLGAGTLAPSPQKLYLNYRNNLLMLYKNLPRKSVGTIIAVRRLMNCMSAAIYLLQGKRENFDAVRRAHRDFETMKRRQNQSERTDGRPRGIYRGSILLRYLFGKRKFGKLL